MEWMMLGWRDGILLLVAMAAVYLVFMLIRLTQMGRQRMSPPAPPNTAELPIVPKELSDEPRMIDATQREPVPMRVAAATSMYVDNMADIEQQASPLPPVPTEPAGSAFEWDEVKSLFGDAMETSTTGVGQDVSRLGGFGEHLSEHLARSDMEMEMQRMKSEMDRMRGEMEALRAANRVSPQYAEAMEMAQRGLTAQDLADRLGISLGEAELVYALSRTDQNFEQGEEDGAGSFAPGQSGLGEFDRR